MNLRDIFLTWLLDWLCFVCTDWKLLNVTDVCSFWSGIYIQVGHEMQPLLVWPSCIHLLLLNGNPGVPNKIKILNKSICFFSFICIYKQNQLVSALELLLFAPPGDFSFSIINSVTNTCELAVMVAHFISYAK